jgi:hypothetical protein
MILINKLSQGGFVETEKRKSTYGRLIRMKIFGQGVFIVSEKKKDCIYY